MSDELKALTEITNSLSIVALLLWAWVAERRERREIQAKLDQANVTHTEAQNKAHAEAMQILKDCMP